jgi:hypothetical protein
MMRARPVRAGPANDTRMLWLPARIAVMRGLPGTLAAAAASANTANVADTTMTTATLQTQGKNRWGRGCERE